jgi:hypothetical protein
MNLQIKLLAELLSTVIALEGSHAKMDELYVLVHVSFLGKTVLTERTLIWLFTSMRTHVV